MSREEIIFQALGEASMCWEPIPTGVFDSERAKQIGERVLEALSNAEGTKVTNESEAKGE